MPNYRDTITRMLLSEMFSGTTDQPLSPLGRYETTFDRKWQNLDKEDVNELGALKTSMGHLYTMMTKNKTADKKIPIEDAWLAQQAKIDKQIELVHGYNNFTNAYTDEDGNRHLGTIPQLLSEVEGVLMHSMATLDQLNTHVFGKKYDNWETLLASGTEEDKRLFRENVMPEMDKNGEGITSVLMKIVDVEKQFYGKYKDQFMGSEHTERDISLLRQMASGLQEELKTNTFLTDTEAKGIQEMWTTKDIAAYETVKYKQKTNSDLQIGMFKAELKTLASQEQKYKTIYDDMVDRGATEYHEEEMTLGQVDDMIVRIQADRIKKELQMLKTGEFGMSTGLGANFDLDPLSPEVKKMKEEGKFGLPIQEPPDDDSDKDKTWDSSIHGADSTPEQRKQNRLEKYGMKKKEYYEILELYNEGDEDGKPYSSHGVTLDDFITRFKTMEDEGGEEIEEEVVDLDAMINEYTNIFTGTGFSGTDEGKAFADKHGLNVNSSIMKGLQTIANAKRNDPNNELPNTQPMIDKTKAKMTGFLEDVRAENIGIKIKKATNLVEKYVHGNKLSEEEMKNIKNVIPNIDEIISKYKEEKKIASKYGSGLSFKTWLKDNKDIYSIDYNKLAGTL